MDNRAQSIGLARFFLSLLVGVPVVWIVWKVTDPILQGSKNATNNATANQATDWISQGVNWLPVWILLLSFMGIMILAIYQRELLQ